MDERWVAGQVYRVFIKATPQAVWEAITRPEWVEKYGYACRAEFELRPGGTYRAFATSGICPTPSFISSIRTLRAGRQRR
jgi:hypothetical protein